MDYSTLAVLFLGLLFGTCLGVLLMSVLAMAKRCDPTEIEMERQG